VIPALIGFAVVRAIGSSPQRWCRHDPFRLVLGTGLGIGLCSACSFAGLLSGVPGLLLEALLLLGAGTAVALRWKTANCLLCQGSDSATRDRVLTAVLGGALLFLLLLDVLAFVSTTARAPHGGWDALAIWNLRARFLFRAGDTAWRDAFNEAINWSHPDYPILLPMFIARSWKLLGAESPNVPIALACFFTFGSVGLMVASLSTLRGLRQGLLAGLAMAAIPILYVQGAGQYADVPVSFFLLGTLGAMAMADRCNNAGFAALAGAMAALGGWTKNEGLLWFGSFLLARLIVARFRRLPAFLAGAAPILATVLLFKTRVATSSDIFGTAGRVGIMDRFLDPARYVLILQKTIQHVWNFGPLLLSPFVILAIYLALAGVRHDRQDRSILGSGALALAFTSVGYFFIYVLRSLDLAWLLATSMDRLILQLWPSIVFVVFLAARAPEREAAPLPTLDQAGLEMTVPCDAHL
jgi:hypothetical protein